MNAAGRRIKRWPQPLAILLGTSSFVRCNHRAHGRACDTRRTLSKPLEDYVRPPACRCCGRRKYRVDVSRTLERGRYAKKACRCGEYPFPHRVGSKWCALNKHRSNEERDMATSGWRPRRK